MILDFPSMIHVISNISSKATGLTVTKFHVDPPWAEGMKIHSNHSGHMTVWSPWPYMVKTFKNL